MNFRTAMRFNVFTICVSFAVRLLNATDNANIEDKRP